MSQATTKASNRGTKVSQFFKPKLLKLIKQRAEEAGMSQTEYIETLVAKALKFKEAA